MADFPPSQSTVASGRNNGGAQFNLQTNLHTERAPKWLIIGVINDFVVVAATPAFPSPKKGNLDKSPTMSTSEWIEGAAQNANLKFSFVVASREGRKGKDLIPRRRRTE